MPGTVITETEGLESFHIKKTTSQSDSWLCLCNTQLLCWHTQIHQSRKQLSVPGPWAKNTDGQRNDRAVCFLFVRLGVTSTRARVLFSVHFPTQWITCKSRIFWVELLVCLYSLSLCVTELTKCVWKKKRSLAKISIRYLLVLLGTVNVKHMEVKTMGLAGKSALREFLIYLCASLWKIFIKET